MIWYLVFLQKTKYHSVAHNINTLNEAKSTMSNLASVAGCEVGKKKHAKMSLVLRKKTM